MRPLTLEVDDCGIPSRKVKPYHNVVTEQKRVVWPAKVGRRAKGPCDPGLSIGLTMTCYFACSACSLCSLSNDGPQGANVTWLLLNQFTR